MSTTFTVKLSKLIKEFNLEPICLHGKAEEIEISSTEVNRPGLHLSGFYKNFEPTRIQIIGNMEYAYLEDLDPALRQERLSLMFSKKIPVLIVTSNLEIFPEMIKAAQDTGIPLLRTHEKTSAFMSALISFLSVELGPRITRHGVLVEVYGEGMLILGESGVGKSETAMELIKRGHRLIADDAVEIRKVSSRTLVGSSPANIRHFMELRGIGIVNARRLFGMGAIKITEKIDLVIKLEPWDSNKFYDRTGMDVEYAEIMDVKVPQYTIPVKPGRNLAVILEVAAMNNRQKKMGYNAATELMEKLGLTDDEEREKIENWDLY
ncbi:MULTISPECIES: HPr(Ser) kinase/phosphatase [Clostridiaceae]|uniref:HPr kinase/phosphorylase n=1 Tax=Clostridium facile TaxID=2763035 RepID=A0ABR7INT3_9CLOT|nr:MULTISPECIES: HPr(Ser) kinase/phosphatase [Clostridiaceae]MBC5786790.1 HPr(Ser) kinase/phosphatase [Clostridium facile]PWM99763.1 MAG: HPr(Ser) kinase/phosphatase [Massilioclostridium sp.]